MTFTDHGELYWLRVSAVEPDPATLEEAVVWVDPSTDPATIRRWSGADWEDISSGGGGGVTDHGALTGLADDDHVQYTTTAEATIISGDAVDDHEAVADPHTGYLTAAEGSTAIGGAITTHEAAANPHPDYTTTAELATHTALPNAHHNRSHDHSASGDGQVLSPVNIIIPGADILGVASPGAVVPGAGYFRLEMDANGMMWAIQPDGTKFPLPPAPNTLHNSLLRVNQRALASIASGGWLTDRWYYSTAGSMNFGLSIQAAVPTALQSRVGAQSSLYLARSSATGAVVAASYEGIWQSIAGHDWQRHHGQPNVVSFWARSSKAGTYGVSLSNGVDRTYPGTFTITTPDTWEYKVKVFPAVTAGTWLFTNGLGARLMFTGMSGSNYHGVPNAWNSNILYAPNTISNNLTAINDYLNIAAPKFEPGILPTTFEAKSYTADLNDCLYFDEVWGYGNTNEAFGMGFQALTTTTYMTAIYALKRAVPTLGYSAVGDFIVSPGGAASIITLVQAGRDRGFVSLTHPVGTGGYTGAFIYANNANARLMFDARLI